MDRHDNKEAQAMLESIRYMWGKQDDMNDLQRVAANSFALGLTTGRQIQRGEKSDERKQQIG